MGRTWRKDLVLRKVDPNGNASEETYTWKVVDIKFVQPVLLKDLTYGDEYSIWVPDAEEVLPFKLVARDPNSEVGSR